MKRITMMVLLASMFSGNVAAQGAPNDEQARALAIDAVAKTAGVEKAELNTKRLEDVEDDLFSFQAKISGQIRKGAYFYRVEDGGWHIISPSEVTYSTHVSHVWYVAIATSDGEAFGLLGFNDADAEFQQLVSKIPVQVKDASEATSFAKFYLKTVYGNAGNVVYDELRLRHNVEEHFVGYADSQESPARKEQRFRAWWTTFKTKSAGPLAPTAKAQDKNQYRVLLNILGMTIGRPPELSRWSIQVRSDGTTQLMTKQPVFPTPSKRSKSNLAAPTSKGAHVENDSLDVKNGSLRVSIPVVRPRGIGDRRDVF